VLGSGPCRVPLARDESDLIPLFDDIPKLQVNFYLLVHRDMRQPPRTRAFFDATPVDKSASVIGPSECPLRSESCA
jgi:hypothetical protein